MLYVQPKNLSEDVELFRQLIGRDEELEQAICIEAGACMKLPPTYVVDARQTTASVTLSTPHLKSFSDGAVHRMLLRLALCATTLVPATVGELC